MKLILERLGVGIQFKSKNTYVFDAKNLISSTPDVDLCRKIRGSFLMASPLLYRFGETRLPIPGGDIIGRRRLDTHFKDSLSLAQQSNRMAILFVSVVKGIQRRPVVFG
jgi:UDP-N-acetylglucosamine enolpyruvyl transferase